MRGADLLDGTPLLDIKPYLPYADALPEARAGFAAQPPMPRLRVRFEPEALRQLHAREKSGPPELEALIRGMLELDPRPAYRRNGSEGESFGIRIFDLDVKWRVEGDEAVVTRLVAIPSLE